jgi:membrane-bound ClpP family serine protease
VVVVLLLLVVLLLVVVVVLLVVLVVVLLVVLVVVLLLVVGVLLLVVVLLLVGVVLLLVGVVLLLVGVVLLLVVELVEVDAPPLPPVPFTVPLSPQAAMAPPTVVARPSAKEIRCRMNMSSCSSFTRRGSSGRIHDQSIGSPATSCSSSGSGAGAAPRSFFSSAAIARHQGST